MEKAFTSLAELRTEIDLLKIKRFQQEEELKEQLSNPTTVFRAVTSLFKSKKAAGGNSLSGSLFGTDLLSYISRFAFPLLLNRTIFKRAGFITKSIVTFVSQKAAQKVNTSAIAGVIDKVKGWLASKKKERNKKAYKKAINQDYGIPPDSESY